MMAEDTMAGTHLDSRWEIIPDCRSCDAETAGPK